jgi:A/G-specific adenine glycosylase
LAVAEILLQKTRAPSIKGAYEALILRYSSPEALAEANPADLETLLRPLGLWKKRSAQLVNMGKAAVEVGVEVFSDWRLLRKDVPGIGAYGARAIACFGGGEAVGIVDANIARIIRRLFRIKTHDPRAVTFQHHADHIASACSDVRATNFGLLDIGAAVCTPQPKCTLCPLEPLCPRYGVPRRVKLVR